MKKIFIIIGIVFVILLLVGGISISFLAIKGARLDKDSKKYADSIIMAIVKEWSEEEAIRRSSPELKNIITKEELNKFFNTYRRLGKLKSYGGAIGQSNISLSSENGIEITAHYEAKAEFEAGSAKITIDLIKHDDEWQILKFNIDSTIFFE